MLHRLVVIVRRNLPSEGDRKELLQTSLGHASLRMMDCRWPPPCTHKLLTFGYNVVAMAEVHGYRMNAVRVDHDKRSRCRFWEETVQVYVSELNTQPEHLKRGFFEEHSIPSLYEILSTTRGLWRMRQRTWITCNGNRLCLFKQHSSHSINDPKHISQRKVGAGPWQVGQAMQAENAPLPSVRNASATYSSR